MIGGHGGEGRLVCSAIKLRGEDYVPVLFQTLWTSSAKARQSLAYSSFLAFRALDSRVTVPQQSEVQMAGPSRNLKDR